ncbi:hypothetical protein PIB30_047098 [Stylosanthes scabra]|uniref:Uncharacterized protein n=1 Tax=Stylosanthes scabra TaxID=79078 RepID=A0ABU6YF82_9FABA|nr:hypothetical protein [Stylosanthes scabra]
MEETGSVGSRIGGSLNSFLSVSSFPSQWRWRGGTPGGTVAAAAKRQRPLLLLGHSHTQKDRGRDGLRLRQEGQQLGGGVLLPYLHHSFFLYWLCREAPEAADLAQLHLGNLKAGPNLDVGSYDGKLPELGIRSVSNLGPLFEAGPAS